MIARVIEPPAPIVTWLEAKDHLLLDTDDQRSYVEGLIAAAQAWIDGPGGWLGHSFGEQTIEFITDGFCDTPMPFGPFVEVVSIKYQDTSSVEQVMAPDAYRLLLNGAVYAESCPATHGGPESVTIRLKAGYPPRMVAPEGGGDAVPVSTIPASIREAVLLLVGQWFHTRSAVRVGDAVNEMPFAVQALLAPYRSWRS